jgi:hypothetical protein
VESGYRQCNEGNTPTHTRTSGEGSEPGSANLTRSLARLISSPENV